MNISLNYHYSFCSLQQFFFIIHFFFVSFLGGNEGIYCVFDYWRSTSLYYCLDNDENIDKATTTSMKTNDGMYTD